MYVRTGYSGNRGFTLTELLAVVAIIVLLTAIAVPNVRGIIIRGQVRKSEADIANLKTALEAYRQAFGRYPGDEFPSEDVNNNGILDAGEDIGVNLDPNNPQDAGPDANTVPNGLLDKGDGVINILDLEWALRTAARGGPFIDDFPVDGWGNQYVYTAPYARVPLQDANDALALDSVTSEDTNGNGVLDATEDIGIGVYTQAYQDLAPAAIRAGQQNGVLDFGDDDNMDALGLVTWEHDGAAIGSRTTVNAWELGNADISPDGYARNRGYYLYSTGIDGVDNTHSGYEDITGNNVLDIPLPYVNVLNVENDLGANGEDLGATPSGDLDTGYEDTGLDGRPNTKDLGEDDLLLTTGVAPATEDFANNNDDGVLNVGNDDINSWNETRPWRQHPAYN